MAGVEIPITPVRRQWFTTSPLPEIPSDFPFVIDIAQSLYFHREGNGLLIGMSNPDEPPGFDQNVDPEWELVNVEAAAGRLPLLVLTTKEIVLFSHQTKHDTYKTTFLIQKRGSQVAIA